MEQSSKAQTYMISPFGLEPHAESTFVVPARIRILDWKQQVEKAMHELDPARLTARVHDAEWAIFQGGTN
jgi:hypothetical protein